jgi:hypothetical protein
MDQIIKFNEADMDIVVQPSVSVSTFETPFPLIGIRLSSNGNGATICGVT